MNASGWRYDTRAGSRLAHAGDHGGLCDSGMALRLVGQARFGGLFCALCGRNVIVVSSERVGASGRGGVIVAGGERASECSYIIWYVYIDTS